jgi:uncharacterized protein with GYD domain
LIFINLIKYKEPLTKEIADKLDSTRKKLEARGIKFLGVYVTLGSYDAVVIIDAPDVKEAFKSAFARQEVLHTDTLVALTREEASKLLSSN